MRIGKPCRYFNPRTPYGVRQPLPQIHQSPPYISIHAPHTECDKWDGYCCPAQDISIHAPHTECDVMMKMQIAPGCNFNPRTPYGVRRQKTIKSFYKPNRFSLYPRKLSIITIKHDLTFLQAIQIRANSTNSEVRMPRGFYGSLGFAPRAQQNFTYRIISPIVYRKKITDSI